MMRHEWVVAGMAVLLLGVGIALQREQGEGADSTPINLEVGTPYAIETVGGVSTFDLQFGENQQYLLIVGSLGSGNDEFAISGNAEPISSVKTQPLTRVAPLDARQIHPKFAQNIPAIAEKKKQKAGFRREFFMHITDADLENPLGYHRVRSRLIAEGKQVRIYLDSDQSKSELSCGTAAELVRLFDEEIQPTSGRYLGCHYDVDGDGKFAILLTHWLGKLQGGRTSVGGFVRGSDFRKDIAAPFSNRADVMYLNSNVKPGPALKTLLAHEYAHAILFSARQCETQRLGGGIDEEDWLNEAIAHVAENLQSNDWSNLDHRIHAFTQNPGDCPLVIADYYRTHRWRDHGCRGATYLFLRWCVDTYGEGLLHDLIHSRSRGLRNVERATGTSFADLFRQWTIALARCSSADCSPRQDSPAGLHYLSLQGCIGDYGLQGISRDDWDVSTSQNSMTLCGTSGRYVKLRSSGASGTYRITISTAQSARLQLTLMKFNQIVPPSRNPAVPLALIESL